MGTLAHELALRFGYWTPETFRSEFGWEPNYRRAFRDLGNPYGVGEGQVWIQTDYRERDYYWAEIRSPILVLKVAGNYGYVVSLRTGAAPNRLRKIRLDRFCPKHHYRLLKEDS